MVNEAIKVKLVRHVDAYRVNAKAARITERDYRERLAARIELCKARTRADVQRMRDDGMPDEQIKAAYKALGRLMAGALPLATIQITRSKQFPGLGTSFAVPVYDDG